MLTCSSPSLMHRSLLHVRIVVNSATVNFAQNSLSSTWGIVETVDRATSLIITIIIHELAWVVAIFVLLIDTNPGVPCISLAIHSRCLLILTGILVLENRFLVVAGEVQWVNLSSSSDIFGYYHLVTESRCSLVVIIATDETILFENGATNIIKLGYLSFFGHTCLINRRRVSYVALVRVINDIIGYSLFLEL